MTFMLNSLMILGFLTKILALNFIHCYTKNIEFASVAEQVDALDLKSSDHFGRGGSSPPARTNLKKVFL